MDLRYTTVAPKNLYSSPDEYYSPGVESLSKVCKLATYENDRDIVHV